MKQFRVLVFTDHSGHSGENSMYALLTTMLQHPGFSGVAVASRGYPETAGFFSGQANTLWVRDLDPDFGFTADGSSLQPNREIRSPEGFDALFLRLPPPAPRPFFSFLETWAQGMVIFNRPSGILETSSKAFLMHFRQWCPPMKLMYNIQDITLFSGRFPIVLKPLYNYGGKGIVKVDEDTVDTGKEKLSLLRYFESLTPDAFPMLAMKYLENVRNGDKRILVVNGEVQGASLRLPAEDSWLCNVAMGGYSVPTTPNTREMEIAEHISPVLLERGILIFGFDTLEDGNGKRYLSEVNTMSIGGMPQIEEQTGKPVLKRVIALIWQYIEDNA